MPDAEAFSCFVHSRAAGEPGWRSGMMQGVRTLFQQGRIRPMSNPYAQQPFSQPEPWQGQQMQTQQHWQSAPPVSKQSNGLAITALVVAVFALLMALGVSVFVVVSGGPSFDGGMEGTAPQVVAGQEYPGRLLENELTRLIRANWGEVTSLTCPGTPAVEVDTVTVCHGEVDGFDSTYRVSFEDAMGHFTVEETVD